MSLAESTLLSHAPRIASRIIDGRAVIVVIDAQTVHTLNDVGSRVWAISNGRTLREVVDTIVAEFEIEHHRALEDVSTFVLELSRLGALRVQGS